MRRCPCLSWRTPPPPGIPARAPLWGRAGVAGTGARYSRQPKLGYGSPGHPGERGVPGWVFYPGPSMLPTDGESPHFTVCPRSLHAPDAPSTRFFSFSHSRSPAASLPPQGPHIYLHPAVCSSFVYPPECLLLQPFPGTGVASQVRLNAPPHAHTPLLSRPRFSLQRSTV